MDQKCVLKQLAKFVFLTIDFWKVDFELNQLNKEANALQKQIVAKKKVR